MLYQTLDIQLIVLMVKFSGIELAMHFYSETEPLKTMPGESFSVAIGNYKSRF